MNKEEYDIEQEDLLEKQLARFDYITVEELKNYINQLEQVK